MYAGVAVLRTVEKLTGKHAWPPLEAALLAATTAVSFASTLSILFLAVRTRAPVWDYPMVAIIPLFAGGVVPVRGDTGDLDENATPTHFQGIWMAALGCTLSRHQLLLGMYGDVVSVISGAFIYLPANGEWRPMARRWAPS